MYILLYFITQFLIKYNKVYYNIHKIIKNKIKYTIIYLKYYD